MVTGDFTIDQFPASLQDRAPGIDYASVQYLPYGGPASVPQWLWRRPEKPRVALTMGLSATDIYSGYTIDTQDALDALADLDIELVATVADSERAKLRHIPDNARLLPFVPLHVLAPTCSAVIHHAGPGTLATVARYGVPQIAIPYSFDEPIFADRLEAGGAGIRIPNGAATGRTLREAVCRVLAEDTWARGADALRGEIERLPTPAGLVPRIEELTAKYRTDPR